MAPVSIRALALMTAPQTLPQSLACVFGAVRVAARESSEAVRCGLLKAKLLFFAVYFGIAVV